jgi:hypothetical protein
MKTNTSTAISTNLKTLACGMGALAVTAVLGWTFIQSTSAAPTPGSHAVAPLAQLALQRGHIGFGQSQPAVLVD